MATGRSRFDIVVVKLCPFNMVRLTPVVVWLSYSPLDPRFVGSNLAGVNVFFQS